MISRSLLWVWMQQLENFPNYILVPRAIVAKRVISVINHCLNIAAIAFILQLDLYAHQLVRNSFNTSQYFLLHSCTLLLGISHIILTLTAMHFTTLSHTPFYNWSFTQVYFFLVSLSLSLPSPLSYDICTRTVLCRVGWYCVLSTFAKY